MVKLFACRARGLEFDSRSRRYDFRDWLSFASNRDMIEISPKRCKFYPHNNQQNQSAHHYKRQAHRTRRYG